MKFCPECGSDRNGEDKCFCGYNYITGEMEKKEEETNTEISGNIMFNDVIPVFENEPKRGLLEVPPEWDPYTQIKNIRFCPECGKVIEEGKNDCPCGYKPLGAYVNLEELKKD